MCALPSQHCICLPGAYVSAVPAACTGADAPCRGLRVGMMFFDLVTDFPLFAEMASFLVIKM